jgi:hypothetical protein
LIVPVTFGTRSAVDLVQFPVNLVFLALLTAGLIVCSRSANRGQVMGKLLIAATLPLGGLLVYLPWPRFEAFYGLPFLVGVALWVAILLGQLGIRARWKVGIATCWLVVLGGSAIVAAGKARYTRARREANHALVYDLLKRSPGDTVFIASPALSTQAWQNPAATLARYVVAVRAGETTPVLVDVDCERAAAFARRPRPRTTLYVDAGVCGSLRAPDRQIRTSFSRIDGNSLRVKPAPVIVNVFEAP